jgi:hypothetical protein
VSTDVCSLYKISLLIQSAVSSDLRKELLGLVPLEEDQAPEVTSAIDEWKQTEDLEGMCIDCLIQ